MLKIGYGRVSTDGQSLEAQEAELRAKTRGVIFGRKPKLTSHQRREARTP